MFTQERIKELRSYLGLSVAKFAEKLGVSRQTIYFWESGYCHPRFKESMALEALAQEAQQKVE